MIELERHIEILLLNNDCVIVPDFGGFMAHHIDARYDMTDGTFLPPIRTIGFNPQLKMNDSLLAQSYIEAYDISYPEALRRIEDEVNELRQHLANDGMYEMNDIGTLRLNENGNYEFEPCEAGILTPDLYGLSSLEIKTLAQENEEQERQAVLVDINTTKANPEEKPETVQRPVFYDEDDEDENRTISIKVSLLQNIAAACIAIIAFFAIATPLGTNNRSSHIMSKIDTGLLYRIMPKDVVSAKGELKTIQEVAASKEQKTAQKPTANKLPEIKSTTYYTIVLASKVSKSNADGFVDRLRKNSNIQAVVLDKPHNTKVIYGHYASESEAYSALNKLNSQDVFKDSWVTKVED